MKPPILSRTRKTPRKRKPVDANPKPKAQYNFTDPESKIMKVSNKGFDQCGNAQAVANEEQIIIAANVTPQANDKRQVIPMVEQSHENLQAASVDEEIGDFDADAGYFSEANVSYLEGEQIDPYIATERLKHHEKIPLVPKGRPPKDLTAKQRMARKLRTKEGSRNVCQTQGDDRADLRPDQTGSRFSSVLDARDGEDAWRMEPGLHDAQFVEAVS